MIARDWIEFTRDTLPFVVNHNASESTTSPWFTEHHEFEFERDKAKPLILSIPGFHAVDFASSPGFISISSPHSVGSHARPTAPDPAPAQTASQITMVWTDNNKSYIELGYDETVGMPAPPGVMTYDDQYSYDGAHGGYTGKFLGLDVVPHRADGYPAVIVIGGLRKWYRDGILHRKGNHPALIADYVGAIWMESGKVHRSTGPSKVLVEEYREYHRDGMFEGFRHKRVFEEWDSPPITEFHGATNPFSNRYFSDPQDEMIHAAQNLS